MNPADNKVRYSTYLACLNKSANRFGGIDRKEEESSDSTVGSPCPPPSLSLPAWHRAGCCAWDPRRRRWLTARTSARQPLQTGGVCLSVRLASPRTSSNLEATTDPDIRVESAPPRNKHRSRPVQWISRSTRAFTAPPGPLPAPPPIDRQVEVIVANARSPRLREEEMHLRTSSLPGASMHAEQFKRPHRLAPQLVPPDRLEVGPREQANDSSHCRSGEGGAWANRRRRREPDSLPLIDAAIRCDAMGCDATARLKTGCICVRAPAAVPRETSACIPAQVWATRLAAVLGNPASHKKPGPLRSSASITRHAPPDLAAGTAARALKDPHPLSPLPPIPIGSNSAPAATTTTTTTTTTKLASPAQPVIHPPSHKGKSQAHACIALEAAQNAPGLPFLARTIAFSARPLRASVPPKCVIFPQCQGCTSSMQFARSWSARGLITMLLMYIDCSSTGVLKYAAVEKPRARRRPATTACLHGKPCHRIELYPSRVAGLQ
ncbi:hypothetical protein Purlil1_7896 [Purpureocillium lilacinum]|uniref:Uncharacterized protein n=1 Tax=Purpureocillium lilacinum TaxID=33203 RepID=A0ABR0BUS3_PURLI|nr:hypothetical protein Purlil1_7896 [Purpureocillium lilacinum]